MQRRTALSWLTGALGAASAAVVAAPGVRYAMAALAHSGEAKARSVRLTPVANLTPGEARLIPVTGVQVDAWQTSAEQVLGKVWVLRTDAGDDPAKAEITVLSAECPHAGCEVGVQAAKGAGPNVAPQEFYCGCHQARFELPSGDRLPGDGGQENPSLRGLDPIDHRIVQDADTGEPWLEVDFQRFEIGSAERTAKG